MNPQANKVWKFLAENNVKYLTIGGLAVNIYGYGRNTGDIDIYIEDTLENRVNLKNTLKKLGLGEIESFETFQFVPDWTDFSLNFGLKLDVMTSVKGLEEKSFEELLNNAMIAEIDGVSVYFIDYDNLIISKKAANPPKDLLDIQELEKVNNSN